MRSIGTVECSVMREVCEQEEGVESESIRIPHPQTMEMDDLPISDHVSVVIVAHEVIRRLVFQKVKYFQAIIVLLIPTTIQDLE